MVRFVRICVQATTVHWQALGEAGVDKRMTAILNGTTRWCCFSSRSSNITLFILLIFRRLAAWRYLGDRLLWHAAEAGIQLQMFASRQKVTDGVKLGTVAHQLVDSLHLCQHAETQGQTKHSYDVCVPFLDLVILTGFHFSRKVKKAVGFFVPVLIQESLPIRDVSVTS